MQTDMKAVRFILIALGLWTLLLGLMVIFSAVAQLRTFQEDPLSDASIVLLFLGVLLALGGACLAHRGLKYGTSILPLDTQRADVLTVE